MDAYFQDALRHVREQLERDREQLVEWRCGCGLFVRVPKDSKYLTRARCAQCTDLRDKIAKDVALHFAQMPSQDPEWIARSAYEVADAMLAERNKDHGERVPT